ncbi:hypothetical protein NI35_2066 [Salmonella enterica subsp. enterica serovar Cerro]|uniref:Uncharacterized protein n=1 Tax=Salmonella enterica I TaxID=59201 RepID=A0A3S4F5V5_SALET|nr:hypothetical protein GW13_PRO1100 [Salmonella enterica subsp. enterica serovar Cerro]KMN26178.1 hypothetical protein NI35_2066 [Salmonella enterica subsp. enterica serovar Cerro]SUF64394.1 Uncharacterised protein [Salmonella enterica]VEA36305.1 Uncharacterised protein [Salmonella enterica subsp. enterica]
MTQQDWHPADIIAGLKNVVLRCQRFPDRRDWRPPRWQMRLPVAGPKAKG